MSHRHLHSLPVLFNSLEVNAAVFPLRNDPDSVSESRSNPR